MKKILLLLVLLSSLGVKAQEKISFPDSFNLDSKLLNGMIIAKIPDELQEKGVIGNPGVTEDKDVIKWMSKLDSEDILQVYYQIYQGKEDDSDDAGVIVTRFDSAEALENSLKELRDQSNLAYLIKDNYLIEVWSDTSVNSTEQIAQMVHYYQNKLQAELYKAEDAPRESVSATSTVEPEEHIESY